MPNNLEIYQSAKLLIDQYGDDGAIDHCDSRIMALMMEREAEGAGVWKNIRTAVRNLLDGAPGPDEIVN